LDAAATYDPPLDTGYAGDQPAVRLVVSNGGNSLEAYARELLRRLDVDAVEAPGSSGSFGHSLLSLECLRRAWVDIRLVRTLRSPQAQLLHFTSHHLARYGLLARTPYIVTVHDLFRLADCDARRGDSPLICRPNTRDRLLLAADAAGITRAAAVIAVSQGTASEVQARLGVAAERLHVVREGVDPHRFAPAAPPTAAWPYVLFVGSEQPRKNLATLLRAVGRLVSEPGRSDLRIVKVGGPGGPEAPYRERLRSQARLAGVEDRLVVAGRVSHDELVSWYSGAVCLVLPSVAEGFGLPVVEAMACGCPVIIPDRSGQVEAAGSAALRYGAPADVDRLAAAIARMQDDAALRADLRRRGLRRARELTWERTAERTRAVYRAVLARERSHAGRASERELAARLRPQASPHQGVAR